MAAEKYARARFLGDQRYDVESGNGHQHITLDGDGQAGPSPMDAMLGALAGCSGIDVVDILKKMRQDITGLEINVHGIRANDPPKVYTEIAIEYIVTGHNIDEDKVRRAVELSETKYCSVGVMLGKTATISHEIRVVAAD